jgi:2-C-methyl-D-erythritol 4-phosphate cytidylyltransferase
MGEDKIFMSLAGKPLIAWAVDICQNYQHISQIVLVLNESNLDTGRRMITEHGWSKVKDICRGGQQRQDSVKNGLDMLAECDWVLIHDGARPFLTHDLIADGLEAAQSTGAAAAAIPVKDTIKVSGDNGIVRETLKRQHLWAVQTPQVFRFDIITHAYKQVKDSVTDDASLVEKLGYQVKLYMGSYRNIKVTTPEDMALAEILTGDK